MKVKNILEALNNSHLGYVKDITCDTILFTECVLDSVIEVDTYLDWIINLINIGHIDVNHTDMVVYDNNIMIIDNPTGKDLTEEDIYTVIHSEEIHDDEDVYEEEIEDKYEDLININFK